VILMKLNRNLDFNIHDEKRIQKLCQSKYKRYIDDQFGF
jgi:hypothetical protein